MKERRLVKKLAIVFAVIVCALLVLVGVYYLICGHMIPFRKYRQEKKRFEPYITKEYLCESNFFGETQIARLEMGIDAYQVLKADLIDGGWQVEEDVDYYTPMPELISQNELKDNKEYLWCYMNADVFPKVLENKMGFHLFVSYQESSVIIEYRAFLSIQKRPFVKTR
jgi:hypothetical protein